MSSRKMARALRMTPDLDRLGAAIKFVQEHERIIKQYASMHDEVQRAAEQMRDIIDPPGLRRMREMHDQMMAVADPPYLRQLREMFDASQVKSVADLFAGITPAIEAELLGGGISKRPLDEWKLLEPVDPFAGLKALMPAESLSAARQ